MSGTDVGALPPEVNSARMYTGPGTAPMLAAAEAWRALAAELSAAASSAQAAITELTAQSWFGPASGSMAAAATAYVQWLGSTAATADDTAGRLMLAVSDFQQAFAAMVPPPVIAENRSRLAALIASNAVGQNTTAIAAAEAEYAVMWSQDAMAMYGYAARSAAATALKTFTAPPPVTDEPAGTEGGAGNQLSHLLSAIPRSLQGLSGAGGAQASPLDALASAQSTDPVSQGAAYLEMLTRSLLPANDTNISVLYGMGQYARNLNTDLDISQATGGRAGFGSGARPVGVATASTPAVGAEPAAVAARSGGADVVGRLAVPPAWTESVPGVPPAAVTAPAGHGAGTAVAGLAAGRTGRRTGRARGEAHTERIAGRLTGVAEVRHWHVEPGELTTLLGEVAGRPGVHEVYFEAAEQASPEAGPQSR